MISPEGVQGTGCRSRFECRMYKSGLEMCACGVGGRDTRAATRLGFKLVAILIVDCGGNCGSHQATASSITSCGR